MGSALCGNYHAKLHNKALSDPILKMDPPFFRSNHKMLCGAQPHGRPISTLKVDFENEMAKHKI